MDSVGQNSTVSHHGQLPMSSIKREPPSPEKLAEHSSMQRPPPERLARGFHHC